MLEADSNGGDNQHRSLCRAKIATQPRCKKYDTSLQGGLELKKPLMLSKKEDAVLVKVLLNKAHLKKVLYPRK